MVVANGQNQQQPAPPQTSNHFQRQSGNQLLGLRAEFKLAIDANMVSIPTDSAIKSTPKSLIVNVNNGTRNGVRRNADASLTESEKDLSPYQLGKYVEPVQVLHALGQTSATFDASKFKCILKVSKGDLKWFRMFDAGSPPSAILGDCGGTLQRTYELSNSDLVNGLEVFWIEGIRSGEVQITYELWDQYYQSPKAFATDSIHFEVNVDGGPVEESDKPKPGERDDHAEDHLQNARCRAIYAEQVTHIRGISAYIHGMEPMLTWFPGGNRKTMTESLWIGFQTSATPLAWGQVGLLKVLDHSKDFNSSRSGFYAEAATNLAAYKAAIQAHDNHNKFYNLVTYPDRAAAVGSHDWDDGECTVEVLSPEVSTSDKNALQDKIVSHIIPKPRMGSSLQETRFLVLQGGHTGCRGTLPAVVNLRQIPYDTIEMGSEATASVSRLPGTPSDPATIANIRTALGPPVPTNLYQFIEVEKDKLRVQFINEAGGIETSFGNNPDAGSGDVSAQHYNISIRSNQILLWDKYHWNKPNPQQW